MAPANARTSTSTEPPTQEALEAAHCWEAEDRAGSPAMTEFRRRSRYHQAMWREARGYPIGTQPYRPRPDGPPARLVGSRLPLDFAYETGATFITADALDAARRRTATIERHQTLDRQRMWADLLSSEALSINLFGDLAADHALADRAVHAWWPDATGTVADVRFEHSPGRLDPTYLNSLRRFDSAFVLDRGGGPQGIVAVDVNYHERLKSEVPKPTNLWRTLEVAARSGAFRPGAVDEVTGRSVLCVTWLEHLLLLSMLQHGSGAWGWGRYVVVHPAGNSDVAELCASYRELLADPSTFASMTIEELLDAEVLRPATIAALRDRYLPG
jgi:hypothetical protein